MELGMNRVVYGGGDEVLMGMLYAEAVNHHLAVSGHNIAKWSNIPSETIHSTLLARQKGIIDESDIFIALPGGIGTLYELSQVMCHNDVDHLQKPIILFNIDHYFDALIQFLNQCSHKRLMNIDQTQLHVVTNVSKLKQTFFSILHPSKMKMETCQ